MKPRAKKSFRL